MGEPTHLPIPGSEHTPTFDELNVIFVELIGKEYKDAEKIVDVRKREDQNGPYLLEVRIAVGTEGETVGYEYMRKGRYPEGQASETTIYKVKYDKNGDPDPAKDLLATYIDGKWEKS